MTSFNPFKEVVEYAQELANTTEDTYNKAPDQFYWTISNLLDTLQDKKMLFEGVWKMSEENRNALIDELMTDERSIPKMKANLPKFLNPADIVRVEHEPTHTTIITKTETYTIAPEKFRQRYPKLWSELDGELTIVREVNTELCIVTRNWTQHMLVMTDPAWGIETLASSSNFWTLNKFANHLTQTYNSITDPTEPEFESIRQDLQDFRSNQQKFIRKIT